MICLIHPNHPNSTDCRLDPPLGLLYVASAIQEVGHKVKVVDLSDRDHYEIPFADVYGITAYISTLKETKKIWAVCKSINPNCEVVIGGAHATACPEDFFYADYVVRGWGEDTMATYITKVRQATNPFYRLPAYRLVDIGSYSRKIGGEPSLPLTTSRGCPYACSFCGLAKMNYSKPIYATLGQVENHLIQIYDMGIRALNIQDDIFTLNISRLIPILGMIKSMGFKFRCMGRAGYDTERTYELLAEAGCDQVAWGIESGSQYILDRMDKKVRVFDNYDVIRWAKDYGITSRAFFIIGFPGETRHTLKETRRFIELADPDQVFVSNFIPYPGTDVAQNPSNYGITFISKHYDDYYQVSKDGSGGAVIDTAWLKREEFKELETEFRAWLKKRPMRGALQEYEKA